MKGILIAAKNQQVCDSLSELLIEFDCKIVTLTDGIRMRAIDAKMFDVIIVSTPLSDEFGLDLVADLKDRTDASIIVLAKGEIADEVQKKLRFTGAFVIGRPFNKSALAQAIRFASVAKESMSKLSAEKEELSQQLKDLKIVNRAKACLIQYLKLTEEQAHRYIQKQAMDLRKTQREVAEDILKTYVNQTNSNE